MLLQEEGECQVAKRPLYLKSLHHCVPVIHKWASCGIIHQKVIDQNKIFPWINQFKKEAHFSIKPNFSLLAPRDIISPISLYNERKSSLLLIISGSKRICKYQPAM